MGHYENGLNGCGAADMASRAKVPMRNMVALLLITTLLAIVPCVALPAEMDPAAIVRTKSGKDYTFISKRGHNWACAVRIAERHYSSRGYMMGGGDHHSGCSTSR